MHKGEDKIIKFTLTDDSSAPIIIDDLEGMIIIIYQGLKILAKYSLNILTGYETIDVTNSALGIFEINLKRDALLNANINEVKAEIKIQELNTDFTDNKLFTIAREIEIDILGDTLSKNITNLG